MPEFVKDIEEIRQRARRGIEEGPVTDAYQLDKEQTVRILNEALATEIVCVLRYMHHYFMATGVHGKSVAGEFKEHADAERDHAEALADRIQQLGGKPDFNPGSLVARSVSQYVEGETLADMIREDLVAERVVIELYTDMIRFFGEKDPTTRVLLEGLLKDEEEHAADLTDLLYIVEPSTGRTEGVDPGTRPLGLHPEQGVESSRRAAEQPQKRDRERRQERAAAQEPQSAPARSTAGQKPAPGRAAAKEPAGKKASARTAGRQRPEDVVEVPPAHVPGTTGRPTRERPQQVAEEQPATAQDEGAQMGATRAVRVTRPNRKKRAA